MARILLRNYWGSEYEVTLRLNHYAQNNNLYIGIDCWEDEDGDKLMYPEPYGDLTVNLGIKCKDTCAFVDTNNNPGIERWLAENKLAKPTGRVAPSGFCVYPEYEFNMDEVQKYVE